MLSTRPLVPSRFWAIVRAVACVAVFGALACAWVTHRVHAYSERVLLDMGERMMRYAGARHQNAPEQLEVNGATFFLSTGNVVAPVQEVLDQFHAKCNQRNGQLHKQWAEISARRGLEPPVHDSLLDGVYRVGGKDSGVVACAETGEDPLPPEALLARVRRVLATGDLAELGGLRYVYVTRGSRDDLTVFVALWSEGPLNYRTMFPKHGDAPGADFPGFPRPAWTERVLSAAPKSKEAGFSVYSSQTLSAAELLAFYERQLPEHGFTVERGAADAHTLLARAKGRTLVLSVRNDPKSRKGMAFVTLQAD